LLGSDGEFPRGYAKLNFNAGARKNILENIVVPVEDYVEKAEEGKFDIRTLSDLMAKVADTKSSGRKGLECLVPKNGIRGGKFGGMSKP